jgi:hypothetical protein
VNTPARAGPLDNLDTEPAIGPLDGLDLALDLAGIDDDHRRIGATVRQAQDDYQAAAERARQLRDTRDHAILHALADGLTHQQVADATGLRRGRIGQIAMRRTESAPSARPGILAGQ